MSDQPAEPVKPKREYKRKTAFQRIRVSYRPQTVESVAEALWKFRGNLSAVARHHGCDRSSTVEFMDRHKEILVPIRLQAQQQSIDKIEYNLYEEAENGDHWAIEKVLTAKARDRGYGNQVAVTGPINEDGTAAPLIQILLPDNFRGPIRPEVREAIEDGTANESRIDSPNYQADERAADDSAIPVDVGDSTGAQAATGADG